MKNEPESELPSLRNETKSSKVRIMHRVKKRERGRLEATMEFKDLAPEQQEKARACNTPEELLALAKEEGIELTDEQLEAVAGGVGIWDFCDRDKLAEWKFR